jgi:hypothetical protein
MRDWSGNNRYDADTAVITLVGNAPADIGALIAEVERLQSYAADCEQHATFAAEKAAALERAAVVAWLREQANSTNVAVLCARDSDTAHAIERGEHRREEAE